MYQSELESWQLCVEGREYLPDPVSAIGIQQ